VISVEHLTKDYGEVRAVDDLTFEIEEGHVYGFLGPNGAGKSTTMNIMTGCLSATAGRVLVDGHDVFEEPRPAKQLIGYLPEQPPLYVNETPAEYLTFVGEAKGLRGDPLRRQIDEVIGQTGLAPVRHRRISALSKGYRQRVGIAQALLGDPKVIILDEPTIGLDPLQIVEIRDLIKELGRSRTVIFSSHILSEVQAICDRILIIAHGKLVAFDETDELDRAHRVPSEVRLLAEAGADEAEAVLAGVEHIAAARFEPRGDDRTAIWVTTDHDDIYDLSRALFFAFAGQGKALLEMAVKTANLEDVFIGLTDERDNGDGSFCHTADERDNGDGSSCHTADEHDNGDGSSCHTADERDNGDGSSCHTADEHDNGDGSSCHTGVTKGTVPSVTPEAADSVTQPDEPESVTKGTVPSVTPDETETEVQP
jgi:ABC-2 type transport system ATP-binding protein